MDHYGITHTLQQKLAETVTGRAFGDVIHGLRPGDRYVCTGAEEERLFHALLRGLQAPQDIEIVHVHPNYPDAIFALPTAKGRTILSPNWVKAYYAEQLRLCARRLHVMQHETSAPAAASSC